MEMLVARYAAASTSFAAKLSANVRPATGRPASGVLRGCDHAPLSDRMAGFATIATSSSKMNGADRLLAYTTAAASTMSAARQRVPRFPVPGSRFRFPVPRFAAGAWRLFLLEMRSGFNAPPRTRNLEPANLGTRTCGTENHRNRNLFLVRKPSSWREF